MQMYISGSKEKKGDTVFAFTSFGVFFLFNSTQFVDANQHAARRQNWSTHDVRFTPFGERFWVAFPGVLATHSTARDGSKGMVRYYVYWIFELRFQTFVERWSRKDEKATRVHGSIIGSVRCHVHHPFCLLFLLNGMDNMKTSDEDIGTVKLGQALWRPARYPLAMLWANVTLPSKCAIQMRSAKKILNAAR